MGHSASNRKPTRRPARRGFTLVELVTAAALMTIMMLGIIQIFATITMTAGAAQGYQFALEQDRALFDTIHRDIRGMTREGYFRIVANSPSPYGNDLLALTTVGNVAGSWATSGTQPLASAYEAVYTTNVYTTGAVRTLVESGNTVTVDNRRGLLGRGLWLFTGQAGAATDREDNCKQASLAEMSASLSVNQTNRRTQNFLTVWPITSVDPYSVAGPSLRRVLASCCSEFYVEYLVFNSSGGAVDSTQPTGDYIWVHQPRDLWSGYNVNCPRAIRVTVAIHDPDDHAPLGTASRFRGYAMQEVYWIGDP